MEGYFYKTINLINGKFYYGSGTIGNTDYLGSGKLLERAINKHGIENFVHVILKEFPTRKDAYDFEDRFLKLFKVSKNPMSYNLKDSGKGGRTWQNYEGEEKEEILKKISKKSKECWSNPEYRERNMPRVLKMCSMKTKGRTGMKNPEEMIEKIRNSNIETWKDPELKSRHAEKSRYNAINGITGMKGKNHKKESIEKIRKSNTGKHPTEEVKKIISERTKEAMNSMTPEKRLEITNKANLNRAIKMEEKKEKLNQLIFENPDLNEEQLFLISGLTNKTFKGLINKIKNQ